MRLPMLAALAAAVSAGIPCTSDGDCTANEFCRATYSATNECLFNTLECTARGGVGTYCGGLVSPCNANRCLPGMVCQPQLPLIPDQPGICQWKPCTKDAKVCPDGTVVGRDPANNCEFFPCKDCSLVRCLLPVCKDGSTPVILEGDCCPTCRKQCKLSDGTLVPHGWSGQGVGSNWCNSCTCEDGTLSCTELDCTLKCCDPAEKTLARCREGCICCGETGEWVGSIGDARTYTCAGVTQSGPDYTAPFYKPCPQCKLPDGTVVAEGWTGQGTGDNWCNKCWCKDGQYGCTKKKCPECRTDVKKCPDGTIVHRDPLNDCLFPKCPMPCDVTCGGKMGLVCALGFSCIDIATDDCDPQNGGADCLGCCERVICFDDAKICRDGSLVYRDPTNGCKFHPCPVDV